jgi:hypothetical protein
MRNIKKFSDFLVEQQGRFGQASTSNNNTQTQKRSTPPPAKNTTPPPPPAPTPEAIAAEKLALTAKLDEGFKKLHNWLITMFSSGNSAFWNKYKSTFGDNESKAWEGLKTQWDLDCQPTLDELKKLVDQLAKDVAANGKYHTDSTMVTLSKKMNNNYTEVSGWMTSTDDDSLYDTMVTVNDSDEFSWTLNLSNGPVSKSIDTDF